MQAPDISIIYFPVRARAECARMILAYSSIPYTDTDCQKYFGNITFIKYITKYYKILQNIKLKGMSFAEAKKCGKLPFGQLPLLSIDNKTLLAQSGAIDRLVHLRPIT